MHAWASGATLVETALLISAGSLKIVRPQQAGSALARLVAPPAARSWWWRPRLWALIVGGVEVGAGALLLATPDAGRMPAAALAAALFCGFVAVVVVAIHRGISCGCWSSLSRGAAGGAELGRALWLAAISCATAVEAGHAGGHRVLDPGAGVAALAVIAGMLVGAALGSRLGPWPAKGSQRSTADLLHLLGGLRGAPGAAQSRAERGIRLGGGRRTGTVQYIRGLPDVTAVEQYLESRGHHLDWERARAVRRPAPGGASRTAGRAPTISVVVHGDHGCRAVVVAPDRHPPAVFGRTATVGVFATGGALHVYARPARPTD